MSTSRWKGIFSGEAPVERSQFDFFNLNPDLREHALSMCSNKTRFNYAQCSKQCNQDLQLFNTTGPKKIIVHYDGMINKTIVILCYNSSYNFPISHSCEPATNLEDGLDEAAKIVEKCLKRVKTLKDTSFYLDHKKWPTNVMKLEKIRRLLSAKITIHEAIYEDFVEFLNQNQLKKLVLKPDEEFEFHHPRQRDKYLKERPPSELVSNFVIPNYFFKSTGFKKLEYFVSKLASEIEEDDFLESTARVMHLETSTIDSDMLNKKIRRWFENQTVSDVNYRIRNTKSVFDTEMVRNGLPFRHDDLKRADVKILTVFFNHKYGEATIETFSFYDYEKLFPMM